MWKATFRGFLAHKFRLALTTLAIVLGVGFVAGTYILTDTMNAAFDELFDEITRGVDIFVRTESDFINQADDRIQVPESVLADILELDGVEAAEGGVDGYAQLVNKEGEAIGQTGPPTLGVSLSRVERFQVLTLREGRTVSAPDEIVVDARTAEKNAIVPGDELKVLFEEGSERFEVVGIVGFGSADNLGGATITGFELRTAQRLLGEEGAFDAISVAVAGGASVQDVRARIQTVLPDGLEAVAATDVSQEQANAVQEGLGFFRTALLIFAFIALFVGTFIIFNTFNILITQRTRELALLRAIGASGAQVTRAVLLEAVAVGIVAAGLGLGVGMLMASGLRALLEAAGVSLPGTSLRVLPRTIFAAVGVGLVVTVVASIAPARRASRISPMAALREGEGIRPIKRGQRVVIGGGATLIGVALVALALLADWGGLNAVGIGVLLTFLGVTAMTPLFAGLLARVLGTPVAAAGKVAGRLGRNNAARNPRRSSSTAAALMIGLALVSTFTILGSSVKASVGAVIEETLRADYTLQSTTDFTGFSNSVVKRLREDERLDKVVPFRFAEWREPNSDVTRFLAAADPALVSAAVELDVQQGSLDALTGRSVLVHQSVADARGVALGDTIPMRFPAVGAIDMTLVGTFESNAFTGDYLIPLDAHGEFYTNSLDWFVAVTAAAGVSDEDARAAITDVTDGFPNIEVFNQRELRENQEAQIDQALALISALLGLAIIIALLGIVNTLALSVYERTRELGLLRAVGLSRRQTRRMIRWESVIIALMGGLLGLAIGVVFGAILVRALNDEGIEMLSIPGVQLVNFLLLAGVAGVLAAIGPARRAARMDVLEAISYE